MRCPGFQSLGFRVSGRGALERPGPRVGRLGLGLMFLERNVLLGHLGFSLLSLESAAATTRVADRRFHWCRSHRAPDASVLRESEDLNGQKPQNVGARTCTPALR